MIEDRDATAPTGDQSPEASETLSDAQRGPAGSTVYSARQLERVRDVLTRLYAVRRTARFYPIEHSATAQGVRDLMDVVERFHEEGVDVQIAFFEGELLFGDKLMAEESILFDQLIREMTSIGAGSLTLGRGLELDELTRAIAILSTDPAEIETLGGIRRMIHEADLPHVEVGEVKVFEEAVLETVEDKEAARHAYDDALGLMREIDQLVRRNRVASARSVKSVVRSLVDNVVSNRYAMLELTGLKDYDEYTYFHSANVAILALALGSQITNEYRFLSSLGVGALLHDIGKLTVDVEILNKPGALSPEEWALVRQHPVYGAEHAAMMPGLDKSAIVTILEHHMRYDLSGYPQRTPRRTQHLASRIVAVADSYDAMTSRRSYSAARVQDEAMSLLVTSAGKALDPMLVRMFLTIMGVYPPRAVVSLSDGRTAIVIRPSGEDVLRPRLLLIADETGRMVDPFEFDLDAEEGLTIARCLDPASLNIVVEDYL